MKVDDLDLRIIKAFVAAKISASTKYGNDIGIDSREIVTLKEYIDNNRINKGDEKDESEKDAVERSKELDALEYEEIEAFVYSILSAREEEQTKAIICPEEDDATINLQEENEEPMLEIPPEIITEMKKSLVGIETSVSPEILLHYLLPQTPEELQSLLATGSLIPRSPQETVERIKSKDEEVDVKVSPDYTPDKETPEDKVPLKVKTAYEQAIEEVPDLKEAKEKGTHMYAEAIEMEVNAKDISEKLPDAGFDEKGVNVIIFRFSGGTGASLKNRSVMVQQDHITVDDPKYYDFASDYFDTHRTQNPNAPKDLEEDYLMYTDANGNVSVEKMYRKPTDLDYTKKVELLAEFEKLDDATRTIINSDMSPEDKSTELSKIGQKRIELFRANGIEVPTIEASINEDIKEADKSAEVDRDEQQLDENGDQVNSGNTVRKYLERLDEDEEPKVLGPTRRHLFL